jgi:hypothetical protein
VTSVAAEIRDAEKAEGTTNGPEFKPIVPINIELNRIKDDPGKEPEARR